MKIMRLQEVIHCTGLSRSTIYKYQAEGMFPRPIPLVLGGRCIGWLEQEIQDWILDRLEERDRLELSENQAKKHQK